MSSFKWTSDVIRKDAIAGIITGLMAIPLTIGIYLMSEYPIQTGLVTVVFACIIGFTTFLFRPGNYVAVPGIAAGLAPVLAMGVHQFGTANMPFLIFLTWIQNSESRAFRNRYLNQLILKSDGVKVENNNTLQVALISNINFHKTKT